MTRIRDQAIRGAVAKVAAQGAQILIRLGTLTVLARFLSPEDFGLVGMVTAVTGILAIFTGFGLSAVAIQRASITDQQASNLFWLNIAVGLLLWIVTAASAPMLARFYGQPQLVVITVVSAASFLITAAGVQHGVRLQREMKFVTLAAVDVASLVASSALGIGLAIAGLGYWALIAWSLALVAGNTIGTWILAKWVPQRPRADAELGSMVRFGGKVTINSGIVYIAYNLDKILIGRVWGATALGIYGRAYQLISLPTDNLLGAIGGVAFAGLSRVAHDPALLKSYFLKGYKVVLTVMAPVAALCFVFAPEIVLILLGPKWTEVVPIFRLLIPTLVVLAIINPPGWMLFALGMIGRSLAIACVIAVLVVSCVLIGLPHGPRGVALGLSAALGLWMVPSICWALKGTPVSVRDLARTMVMPTVAGLVATAVTMGFANTVADDVGPIWRMVIGGTTLLSVYFSLLMVPRSDREFYLKLLSALPTSSRAG